MLKRLRYTLRLLGLLNTLLRYDLHLLIAPDSLRWLRFSPRRERALPPGQRLAHALQRMGPAFIKLGQTLATRRDVLGDAFAQDLATLQDKLPPFSAATARAIIERSLRAPVETLYREFEDIPVAAASIAQVHRATLPDGTEVAVKVLRPDITKRFARDITFFYWVAARLDRWFPTIRRLKLHDVVALLERTSLLELDLRLEAAAASEFTENTAADGCFTVPTVYWPQTGADVLTLSWVDGTPLNRWQPDALLPEARLAMVQRLLEGFYTSVFRDGFFHADMHAGNVFIQPDGTMCLLDFGIMGRLDMETRLFMAQLILGFINRDYKRLAEVHFEAGYVPANQDKEAFMQACRAIAEPIMHLPLNEISVARLLGQLFRITETFQMETQPQLLLLQKSLVLVEGMCRAIEPTVNMWELSKPPIKAWMEVHLSRHAIVKRKAEEAATALSRLPALVHKAELALEKHNQSPSQKPAIRPAAFLYPFGILLLGMLVGVVLAGAL